MKQTKLNSGVFLLVEVPEDAKSFQLVLNSVYYNTKTGHGEVFGIPCFTEKQQLESLELTHEIIGKGNEITEDVWMDIVESAKTFGYRKYDAFSGEYQWTARAKQSGESLIKSHGMKPETTLILKLKTND